MKNEQGEAQMANDLRSFLNPNETQSQRETRIYGAKVEAYGGKVEEASSSIDIPKVSPLKSSPPIPAPREWYYTASGERHGPETRETMEIGVNSGNLPAEALVWKSGMTDWRPVSQTDLWAASNEPPPLSGENVNNTAVWIWAFAPLIPINAILMAIDLPVSFQAKLMWTIGFAINMVFWTLDGHQLQRAGHNRDGWGRWGILVVPVYLFIRAAKLKQSNGYAIIWLACFAVSILGHRLF
jgi:GYF domain 2